MSCIAVRKQFNLESRASYALIGLFTVAILAVALGAVYWFHTGREDGKTDVRLVFNDKVLGLGRGSNVLFNGLRVGEVSRIDINPADPRQISVVIQVARSTPLRVDTRARLEARGASGEVAVQLIGGESGSAVLAPPAEQSLPTITAEPTEDIFDTVRAYTRQADVALDAVDLFLRDNAEGLSQKIKDAELATAALSDGSGGIVKLMQGADEVATFVTPLASRLDGLSMQLSEAIRYLERVSIASTVDKIDKFTAPLADASPQVAKSLSETASIAARLNNAADQVEGVLKGAQAFLNTAAGKDGRKAFSDVSDVARSIRVLADNLDKRTAEITAEISRFSRSSLRGLETFSAEGRRILSGFGQSLRDVERNPQQLIFGKKPQLPPYTGAR